MADRQFDKFVDRKLERALVSSLPTFATDMTAALMVDLVSFEDFDDPECRRYWRAVEELVAERGGWIQLDWLLQRAERSVTQWGQFRDGVEQVWGREELRRHAEMVADLAAKRRILMTCRSGIELVTGSDMPIEDVVSTVQDHLLGVRSVVPEVEAKRTLRAILADSDQAPDFDWAVPRLFEFRDRVMITGREGGGKSTFLRQLCIQLALGYHPWTAERFAPLRVLMVDLQDGRFRNEREFRMIAKMAGVDPIDDLFIESWDAGLNIVRSQADRRRLEGLIRSTRPHVVALGPVYRMAIGEDATDAQAMQALIDWIDRMRARYDVAWLLEAHSPKSTATSRGVRSYEPFGSQRFMAWPDAGVGLVPVAKNPQAVDIRDWRGNRDRMAKVWPTQLVWGRRWPWVPKDVAHKELEHAPKIAAIQAQAEDPGDEETEPF